MTRIIALCRLTKNVFSLEPNDFVFNSLYNTFKIILEGTKSITLAASTNNQIFTQAHGLTFVPLMDGFAKRTSASQVFKPNATDVELWGVKLGMVGDIDFNYIEADDTNIYMNFDNRKGSTVAINVRYFCLESIKP